MKKTLVALTAAIVISLPLSAHDHGVKSMDECIWSFTPIEFVEWLTKVRQDSVVFDAPADGWVTEADLGELERLLLSEQPCAAVGLSVSSFHNTKPSTVGAEVLFMLNGYLKGRYPPALHSMWNTLLRREEIQKVLATEALTPTRDRVSEESAPVRVQLDLNSEEMSVVLEEAAQDLESLLRREQVLLGNTAIQLILVARGENKRTWRFALDGPCAASDKAMKRFLLRQGDRVRLIVRR